MSALEYRDCKIILKKNDPKWEKRHMKCARARVDISFYNSYVDE